MLVGEAPGFHEDRLGSPFAGQAAELIQRLLTGIGLDRDEVYLTTVLKCRPPGNRDPLADEVAACEPHLFASSSSFARASSRRSGTSPPSCSRAGRMGSRRCTASRKSSFSAERASPCCRCITRRLRSTPPEPWPSSRPTSPGSQRFSVDPNRSRRRGRSHSWSPWVGSRRPRRQPGRHCSSGSLMAIELVTDSAAGTEEVAARLAARLQPENVVLLPWRARSREDDLRPFRLFRASAKYIDQIISPDRRPRASPTRASSTSRTSTSSGSRVSRRPSGVISSRTSTRP